MRNRLIVPASGATSARCTDRDNGATSTADGVGIIEESLLVCTYRDWSPGIGDPSIRGWLTVAIYALSALVAGRVAIAAPFPRRSKRRERVFWTYLALGLVLLTINKQLDLQSFMTAIARCAAQAEGWYEQRRFLQAIFILVFGLGLMLLGLYFLWLLRGTMKRSTLPLLGAILVVGFVLVRAISFHAVDKLIHLSLPAWALGVNVNFLLEVPGPLIIVFSGLWLLKRSDRN